MLHRPIQYFDSHKISVHNKIIDRNSLPCPDAWQTPTHYPNCLTVLIIYTFQLFLSLSTLYSNFPTSLNFICASRNYMLYGRSPRCGLPLLACLPDVCKIHLSSSSSTKRFLDIRNEVNRTQLPHTFSISNT